jgi:hypothetical protein
VARYYSSEYLVDPAKGCCVFGSLFGVACFKFIHSGKIPSSDDVDGHVFAQADWGLRDPPEPKLGSGTVFARAFPSRIAQAAVFPAVLPGGMYEK